MTTTQNATTNERAQESADALAKCLHFVRRASAGGHALWSYHQCYQEPLDQLAADGLIVKWMGQDLTHVYFPWYLESSGYWTREAFVERVTRVIYWMGQERARVIHHGYGDLAKWGDRYNILAHMADWVCALVDLDCQLTGGGK